MTINRWIQLYKKTHKTMGHSSIPYVTSVKSSQALSCLRPTLNSLRESPNSIRKMEGDQKVNLRNSTASVLHIFFVCFKDVC